MKNGIFSIGDEYETTLYVGKINKRKWTKKGFYCRQVGDQHEAVEELRIAEKLYTDG